MAPFLKLPSPPTQKKFSQPEISLSMSDSDPLSWDSNGEAETSSIERTAHQSRKESTYDRRRREVAQLRIIVEQLEAQLQELRRSQMQQAVVARSRSNEQLNFLWRVAAERESALRARSERRRAKLLETLQARAELARNLHAFLTRVRQLEVVFLHNSCIGRGTEPSLYDMHQDDELFQAMHQPSPEYSPRGLRPSVGDQLMLLDQAVGNIGELFPDAIFRKKGSFVDVQVKSHNEGEVVIDAYESWELRFAATDVAQAIHKHTFRGEHVWDQRDRQLRTARKVEGQVLTSQFSAEKAGCSLGCTYSGQTVVKWFTGFDGPQPVLATSTYSELDESSREIKGPIVGHTSSCIRVLQHESQTVVQHVQRYVFHIQEGGQGGRYYGANKLINIVISKIHTEKISKQSDVTCLLEQAEVEAILL